MRKPRHKSPIESLASYRLKHQHRAKVDILEDCYIMASWFADLIRDHYTFTDEDSPALTAALKYLDPDIAAEQKRRELRLQKEYRKCAEEHYNKMLEAFKK